MSTLYLFVKHISSFVLPEEALSGSKVVQSVVTGDSPMRTYTCTHPYKPGAVTSKFGAPMVKTSE